MKKQFIKATTEFASFDKWVNAPYFRKSFNLDFSPEKAEKYALRWQSVIPRNFTASPGGLTQKEAAEIIAGI